MLDVQTRSCMSSLEMLTLILWSISKDKFYDQFHTINAVSIFISTRYTCSNKNSIHRCSIQVKLTVLNHSPRVNVDSHNIMYIVLALKLHQQSIPIFIRQT